MRDSICTTSAFDCCCMAAAYSQLLGQLGHIDFRQDFDCSFTPSPLDVDVLGSASSPTPWNTTRRIRTNVPNRVARLCGGCHRASDGLSRRVLHTGKCLARSFGYTTEVSKDAALGLLNDELADTPHEDRPDGVFLLGGWSLVNIGNNDGAFTADVPPGTSGFVSMGGRSSLAWMMWCHHIFVPRIVHLMHPIRHYHRVDPS